MPFPSAGSLPGAIPSALRSAVLDAVAILAPTNCSGCGAADRTLCESCAAALRPAVATLDLDGLVVAFAHRYDGVVRSVLASYKDGGRTDAASRLAPSLSAAIDVALQAVGPSSAPVRLVTVPSSRAAFRERGYSPVELLLKHCGLRAERALRASRHAEDQAGLSAESRRLNRAGWLEARSRFAGEPVVLVDDILTTGSTLLEARRALEEAGAIVVSAAVLAHTPKRISDDVRITTALSRRTSERSEDGW